jgi:hypothetical protein
MLSCEDCLAEVQKSASDPLCMPPYSKGAMQATRLN